MRKTSISQIILLFALGIAIGLASFWFKGFQRSKKLVAITKNSPTTYFYDRYDQQSGFEYEMLKSFADALGKKLEVKVVNHIDKMKYLLDQGEADLIAAGITRTEKRESGDWVFGPTYARTKEIIVCRRGIRIKAGDPKNTELKLFVVAGSSYVKSLEAANFDLNHWKQKEMSTEEALNLVENAEADCTVSDEHIYRTQSRFAEQLIRRQDLSKERGLAWVLGKDLSQNPGVLERWMFDFLNTGKMEALYEKYYGHSDKRFNRFDVQTFRKRKEERLGQFVDLFKAASRKYNVPWELIAAISYQESHWDPSAVSPTGVRGLMMLTRQTARLMRVNRLKVEESIDGGVRYFLRVKSRLPKSIKEPDRTWVALAAYNVGIGHIFDVRSLIRKNRGNPNSWKEIKFYLPYLAKEKVYSQLRYGYARGWEPVSYVKRIRTYYEILKKDEDANYSESSE